MDGEHERLISDEDEELSCIKDKKLKELLRLKEKKPQVIAKPIPVTDSNFSEMINKHQLALIDCWAPWCGPCVIISPIVEELAKEYAGKAFFGKLMLTRTLRTAGISESLASQHC